MMLMNSQTTPLVREPAYLTPGSLFGADAAERFWNEHVGWEIDGRIEHDKQLDVPTTRVTEILNGRRAITGDTALRLAHFFREDG